MATNKPRITITLTERQHGVLRSISETSGKSMSSFLSELVEETMPTLERIAVAFQRIHQARQSERDRFLSTLEDTQVALEPIVQQVVGQFDMFMAQVEKSAGVGTGARAPGRRPAAAPSPLTNRGDTPPGRTGHKPLPDKASGHVLKKKILKNSDDSKGIKTKGKRHAV